MGGLWRLEGWPLRPIPGGFGTIAQRRVVGAGFKKWFPPRSGSGSAPVTATSLFCLVFFAWHLARSMGENSAVENGKRGKFDPVPLSGHSRPSSWGEVLWGRLWGANGPFTPEGSSRFAGVGGCDSKWVDVWVESPRGPFYHFAGVSGVSKSWSRPHFG